MILYTSSLVSTIVLIQPLEGLIAGQPASMKEAPVSVLSRLSQMHIAKSVGNYINGYLGPSLRHFGPRIAPKEVEWPFYCASTCNHDKTNDRGTNWA
jgi:hypothetical protein